MSGLRQTASVGDNLGQLHIITGLITVTSDTWTLASNDPTCTLTDIGAGNVSITYEAFLSVPACSTGIVKTTNEDTVFYNVLMEGVPTTTSIEFRCHHDTAGTNTMADPDDGDGWNFQVIGLRNN